MKFIILVSNLKEISHVFLKKRISKNYDAILLSKYDSVEKKDTKLCLRVEKWSIAFFFYFYTKLNPSFCVVFV